ncbi:MAG: ATP-binding protein [Gammaproteobacteria bacterium]|nr:ATP-binding protein [Gammaproteobacteria bacterium]
MREVLGGRNRRLLFRSYLLLVGGLLVVAIVLDLGFSYLQSKEAPNVDRWLQSTFHLLEKQLAETAPAERDAVAARFAENLGVGIQLLARDDVHMQETADHRLPPLVDADGNTSYLHEARSIGAIIRLGPIATPEDGLLLRLLPPLFYLSIFAVVGLWLRPILRDIDVISDGARRFAADFREPPATARKTTELTALAHNLDDMAAHLSSVLRSQKELIAALSHEMRTPLARLRFALAVIADKSDAKLEDRLRAMSDDVQEIDDLVASMLNYARLDHPDTEMHWQDVPAAAWLSKIVEKTRSESIHVGTNLVDTPHTVRMDPRLMELALSNLLVNAKKYAERKVHCSLVQEGSSYLLTVSDDGAGVPDEAREKIFKAFTRIDDSRNRATGGYGLGLAVVARVAELHGGRAGVDYSPDLGGARFSIRWPLRTK